jgi:hypothetical protein
VLLGTAATLLVAAPVASAAAIDGGDRNPSNNPSSGYTNETQIIGEVAQNQGGHAPNTGGYVTRQSNKSDSGGGAIYGCRAKAGTEACVSANNLNNGDAFRFQASTAAATIGQLRFGVDINKPVDKPPFVTNATGLVKNLNADKVDGKSAEDFVEKGTLLFASVGANGAIGNNRGVVPNTTAAPAADADSNQTFTVQFASNVSKCVATASPAAVPAVPSGGTPVPGPLVVANSTTNPAMIVVTEPTTTTPYPFSLQVTC